MSEAWSALLVFALLCASAGLGRFVRPHLPEAHRAYETVQTMQVMIGMLVTFAALVLGLLTASVKSTFDRAALDRQDYALQLEQFDQCLRNIGPDADSPRHLLASYTAGVIASTWPNEPPPVGVDYPDTSTMPLVGASPVLRGLLNRLDLELRCVKPADSFEAGVRQDCLTLYRRAARSRLPVLASVSAQVSPPSDNILVFLLLVLFATFGLIAPRNNLALLGIILCAISVTSAVFVIGDLSQPYGGLFAISSDAMRAALAEMTAAAP